MSTVHSVWYALLGVRLEGLFDGLVGRQRLVDVQRVRWDVSLGTRGVEHPQFDDAHEEEHEQHDDQVEWNGHPHVLKPDHKNKIMIIKETVSAE